MQNLQNTFDDLHYNMAERDYGKHVADLMKPSQWSIYYGDKYDPMMNQNTNRGKLSNHYLSGQPNSDFMKAFHIQEPGINKTPKRNQEQLTLHVLGILTLFAHLVCVKKK